MSAVAIPMEVPLDQVMNLFCENEISEEIARAIKDTIRRTVSTRDYARTRIACIRDHVQFKIDHEKDPERAELMTRNLDAFIRA